MLTGYEIKRQMELSNYQKIQRAFGKDVKPNIIINPFDIKCLGTNSYDIHLNNKLLVYTNPFINKALDAKSENSTIEICIPKEGLVLQPNKLYLGSTIEYTETHNLIPVIDGRSSIGRLGLFVHITAGFGDIGFCGKWTLEIVVIHPTKIYPNMRIGQIYYEKPDGKITQLYNGHYQYQRGAVATKINHTDNWQKQ
ncbi:MAG: dCTP deaminase [Rickettsiales bacterium]|jgi:dCTP deaminase|nr:dCTP deaminase [Rickettsiales bacterium]